MVELQTCLCECKKHHVCEKGYIWNPAACSCQNGGKHLAIVLARMRDYI